jgi:2-iminobutanoate/2-iminopropanoate deaminase
MQKLVTKALGPYSLFVAAPINTRPIYFSGVVGLDQTAGAITAKSFEEEVHVLFTNLNANLDAAGVRKQDITKTVVYLTDMKRFDDLNKAFAEYFEGHKPARSTVEVRGLPKNAQVEIDVTAHV